MMESSRTDERGWDMREGLGPDGRGWNMMEGYAS